jgi:hypothetical protein
VSKLRKSAKACPHCMSCGMPNPNGDLLCLAHTNELYQDGIATGRGASHKSNDLLGAIICNGCHDLIDGRRGGLKKDEKHSMHRFAWVKTMRWWIAEGLVKSA